jgi:NAD(P)-dependent dehydrogenase (short-subunit alcohol dehydrogenase family)
VLLDRNAVGLEAARRQLGGEAETAVVDLSSLAAVRNFAATWISSGRALDVLVNNAGLLPRPRREQTAEGFELGFGVSVVGHFALTAGLLPALLRAEAARVVTTSSIAHRGARIDFDDLAIARNYDPVRAYATAKLGALLFALELERRARAAGSRLQSLAAHPGISRTAIGSSWDGIEPAGLRQRLAAVALGAAMRWFSQDAEQGAAPLVQAAATPEARGGEFYGPSGAFEWRGPPRRVVPSAGARDPQSGARLWQALEGATQICFDWRYEWSER